MANYKLTRTGNGALDLSQVLDTSGNPIVFRRKGDACVVSALNATHPLVQRYNGHGLLIQEISLKVGGAPAVPAAAPAPPTPAQPSPGTEDGPVAATTPAPTTPEAPTPEVTTPAALPETQPAEPPVVPSADTVADEPQDSTPSTESGKKGRGGKQR